MQLYVVGGVVYTRSHSAAAAVAAALAWLNLSAAVKILIMPTWAAVCFTLHSRYPSAEQSQHAPQKLGANLVVVIIVLWRRGGGQGRAGAGPG